MNNSVAQSIEFTKDNLNDEEIFRLESGTKYLPSLYIKNNPHLNKWMVFEAKHHQVISNRTFNTQADCIEYITNYDKNSDNTLVTLLEELEGSQLYNLARQLDFTNPKQITDIGSDNNLELVVYSQKSEIATHYKVDIKKIQLIFSIFDGVLSLYVNENTNKQNERIYYIFNNGSVSSYTAWKIVSVAMAINKKLLAYETEKKQHQHLETLIGKAVLDTKGNGFFFEKHIKDTDFVYVQKVRVTANHGQKFAEPNAPLTPLFLGKVSMFEKHVTLDIKNYFKDMNGTDEQYVIEL